MRNTVLVLFLLAACAATASADTFASFDFNSLASGVTNGTIQSYMNGVLLSAFGPGKTVTVTGAITERTYTGDNHVVGPVSSGLAHSLTLGNSDGAPIGGPDPKSVLRDSYDTFLRNRYSSGDDKIEMTFAGFSIASVSFDWEIFPDGTCPSWTNCGTPARANLPDLHFLANGTTIFQYFGVQPGTGGTYNHSPHSGALGLEQAPQALGTTGTITFDTPVSTLTFKDWPAMIGIDNLVVTQAPEPASMLLLGPAILGFLLKLKRRRSA